MILSCEQRCLMREATMAISFQGAPFPKEVILMGVRWEAHGTAISIRQVKYFTNILEQDHRGVKRVTRPMLGCKSYDAAHDTLVGIERMHMIKKRQLGVEAREEGLTAAELCYSLAA